MKKIAFLLLLHFVSGFSQENNKKQERIKALRVAFISTRLDLTPQEAEKFWPVYNDFDKKQVELHSQKKKILLELKSIQSNELMDKNSTKLLDESEIIEKDLQKNRRDFINNLKGIIPIKKIFLLKSLEEEFKSTLLKKFKEQNRNNKKVKPEVD
jgi:hypothetical protein